MISFGGEAYAIVSQTRLFGLEPNWVILIGFLVFSSFVFWGWYSASWKLRQHENTHPKVKIMPISDSKVSYLEVKNKGHSKASFEVRVLRWEGLRHINHRMEYFYNARWESFDPNSPRRIDTELKADGGNRVRIIEDIGDASLTKDVIKYRNVSIPDSRAESFWQAKVKIDTIIQFTIEVLSEPPLQKPFRRTYGLVVNQRGQWTQFKEITE